MENLDSHSSVINKSSDNGLQAYFPPVTLQRPMALFKRMLGLEVKKSSSPSLEFLVQLTSRYPSHQAVVRDIAGEQFKNLENVIRGRSNASSTTLKLISQKIGVDIEFLNNLVHANKEGPLIPEFLKIFQFVESLYLMTYSFKNSGVIICPHCNTKLTKDAHQWWVEQGIGIGQAEYLFAERLLKMVVGGYLLIEQLNSNATPKAYPSNLARSTHHSIGNWLVDLVQRYDCDNLAHLSVKLQTLNINVSHGLLKKWSCGQVLMPFSAAEEMIDKIPNNDGLRTTHIIARALALATDFVASVASESIQRKVAQEIIYQRLLQLEMNVRLIPKGLIVEQRPIAI